MDANSAGAAHLRLECIKVVTSNPDCFIGGTLHAAKDLADFVLTGTPPGTEDSQPKQAAREESRWPLGLDALKEEPKSRAPKRVELSDQSRATIEHRVSKLSREMSDARSQRQQLVGDTCVLDVHICTLEGAIAALRRDLGEEV